MEMKARKGRVVLLENTADMEVEEGLGVPFGARFHLQELRASSPAAGSQRTAHICP